MASVAGGGDPPAVGEEVTYIDFIQNLGEVLGACSEVTERMANVFPELRRARGYYYCPWWGRRDHWWCVDPNGEIVDPTANQFPSKGLGRYEEIPDDAEEPIGRCLQCGEYCFESVGGTKWSCSEACAQSLNIYYGGVVRGRS